MGDMEKNFSRREFECKGNNCCGHSAPINGLLVSSLQVLRDEIGEPITVKSGFRCNVHNVEVAKVEKSEHPKGTAADILWGQDRGVTAEEMFLKAKEIAAFRLGGIGIYHDPERIHVDVRINGPARW